MMVCQAMHKTREKEGASLNSSKSKLILEGKVGKALFELTVPMIFGILGLVAFNLADTYFVGRLGTIQMAALAFTFPVVLVFNSINLGIGIGASVVISKAVGMKERNRVVRLTTDSLSLGFLIAVSALILGELTIDPLFGLLGADKEVMPYISKYMRIWYAGVPFVVIPMVGNNAIRALGDTKTPSMIMMIAAGMNILLDPILIFGIGSIPPLGVAGAALATVLSRSVTFSVALYVLGFREQVLSLQNLRLIEVFESWKAILFIGLPNAIAKMIIPIGAGIITGLIAGLGTEAVAGFGVATRVEYFTMAVILALSSIIPVFVGQNFGAKKLDRIRKGFWISERFSVIFGVGMYAALFVLAKPIASIFTASDEVSKVIVSYLRIVPLGYGFQGILLISNGALNALHMPFKASLANLIQMMVVYVPLAIYAADRYGVVGIFGSLVLSHWVIGIIYHFLVNHNINKVEQKRCKEEETKNMYER